jgi:uncharacterized protein (TIGR02147 family)
MKQNIGTFLKNEFANRKKKNKKYSLRAFSRDLNLSASFLSEVLNGKKKVSIDKALQVSQSLGWSWRESQLFLQTAQFDSVKSKRAKHFLKKEIQKTDSLYGQFKSLKATQFSPISNWYCLAILELTEIPGFREDPRWISKRLGVPLKEAQTAFTTLKEKGLIIQNEFGDWKKDINASVQDTPSSEVRKFHRQHLANAMEAIEKQEFHRRHFSGVTMAIDTDQLPQAIELVREFRSRMNALLETGTKKSVYHLAIQLFQLDLPHEDEND